MFVSAQGKSAQDYRGFVIIHSRNDEGAAAIKKHLPNALLAPFASFEVISEMPVDQRSYCLVGRSISH